MARAFEAKPGRSPAPRPANRQAVPAQAPPLAADFARLANRLHLGAPLQRRAAASPARDFSGIAGPGRPPIPNGLPAALRAEVEARSGLPMDDVRVHRNSPKPRMIGALAYAQGRDIHLGPGQERHLAHEAWHVVQQKQGRVRATRQLKGVGINDDPALEHEAEAALVASTALAAIRSSSPSLQRSGGRSNLPEAPLVSDPVHRQSFSAQVAQRVIVAPIPKNDRKNLSKQYGDIIHLLQNDAELILKDRAISIAKLNKQNINPKYKTEKSIDTRSVSRESVSSGATGDATALEGRKPTSILSRSRSSEEPASTAIDPKLPVKIKLESSLKLPSNKTQIGVSPAESKSKVEPEKTVRVANPLKKKPIGKSASISITEEFFDEEKDQKYYSKDQTTTSIVPEKSPDRSITSAAITLDLADDADTSINIGQKYESTQLLVKKIVVPRMRIDTKYGKYQADHTVSFTLLMYSLEKFCGHTVDFVLTEIKKLIDALDTMPDQLHSVKDHIKYVIRPTDSILNQKLQLDVVTWQTLLVNLLNTYISLDQSSVHATYRRPGKKGNPKGFDNEASCMDKLIKYDYIVKDRELTTDEMQKIPLAVMGLVDLSNNKLAMSDNLRMSAGTMWMNAVLRAFPNLAAKSETRKVMEEAFKKKGS